MPAATKPPPPPDARSAAGRRPAAPFARLSVLTAGIVSRALAVAVAATLTLPTVGRTQSDAVGSELAVRQFTAPDGSRFVLVPEPRVEQVHWAMATFADGEDDPPGRFGLAQVAAHAAQNGPWPADPLAAAAERAALEALDEAWRNVLQRPGDPDAEAAVFRCGTAAAELADPAAFASRLAALPVHRSTLVARDGATVLVMTTVADALRGVAELLLDRRERQPLRGVELLWFEHLGKRAAEHLQDRWAPLRAELLALELPTSGYAQRFERPVPVAVSRALAQATFAASHRPERTVHVLYGSFDPDVAERQLRETFVATLLPERVGSERPRPVPPAAQRRSLVPGTPEPMAAVAFVLPDGVQREILGHAVRWLEHAAGPLRTALAAKGRRDVTVHCRAPWPPAVSGRSLLVVEAAEADGRPGLADDVVAALRGSNAAEPSAELLRELDVVAQREWAARLDDPRQVAAELAAASLWWPGERARPAPPPAPKPDALQTFAAALFATQPVVVEGRP